MSSSFGCSLDVKVADDGTAGMMMQGSNASKQNVRLPFSKVVLHLNNLHTIPYGHLSRPQKEGRHDLTTKVQSQM